jgi:AAA family ATPase
MPPKAKANLNSPTPKKATGSGTGASTSSSSSAKAVPAPKPLIVRPAPPQAAKSAMKIFLATDALKALSVASGDLVHLAKAGADRRGIVVVAAAGTADQAADIVLITDRLRRVMGLLLGDRVDVTLHAKHPEYAAKVVVSAPAEVCEGEGAAALKKAAAKILHDVGIVMPGFSFAEGGQELTVVDATGLPDLKQLSLSDNALDAYRERSNLLTPIFFFDNKKTSIELTSRTRINADLPPQVSYSGIGGLAKQIALLKSKIELPLHRPSLFQRFGMAPDRGFLLHGPPGTGKTMLLRAVAAETNAHVLTINGPSIVSKYLGETESALRGIFAEAVQYQPAIIFIDEIDALVPKRDSDESGEAESRVVSTLLTLMDGMGAGGQVVVVGATNRPNSIDPALRRPGRFGQELEIGIPDAEGRLDILRLMLRDMPHELTEENIVELAGKTHGYVGADLAALCRDAVMAAIQRGLAAGMPEDELAVATNDVDRALVDIRPSAMREIFLETPKVYWTDIGGQDDVKQKLRETIEWPLSHPDTFKRLGVHPPKGILLYGPPGCSKTLTAKALATEAGLNFLAVKGPELFNKFVGESERAVREIFRKARAASPSIIFFDEIDALSSTRGEGEAGGDRVLTSLLNEMDGIEALVGVTILAATNRPEVIDPALMRPGRLDRLVYVAPPNAAARLKILEIQARKMSLGDDVDLTQLAERTDGCSGAEVVALCQEAGLKAMNEDLEITGVASRHFEAALTGLKRGITREMIEHYESFSKEGIE